MHFDFCQRRVGIVDLDVSEVPQSYRRYSRHPKLSVIRLEHGFRHMDRLVSWRTSEKTAPASSVPLANTT